MLKVLTNFNIPFVYKFMLADIESDDEYFVNKFTNGDKAEFLRRVVESTKLTEEYLHDIHNCMGSSTFTETLGLEDFFAYYKRYEIVLRARFEEDRSFNFRVVSDTSKRSLMYSHMYGEYIRSLDVIQKRRFLIYRTIRTMAQYLAIARCAEDKFKYPIIINHPTTNNGLFNDRNRILLSSEDKPTHPAIPVFVITKEVY